MKYRNGQRCGDSALSAATRSDGTPLGLFYKTANTGAISYLAHRNDVRDGREDGGDRPDDEADGDGVAVQLLSGGAPLRLL
jgi:hypothetical protein